MLFLLTDTDRSYNKDKPHAIPVAYGLKGKSLTSVTARQMVSDVRDFLHTNNINVLIEAYDGQWSNIVFRDSEDKPLTLFKLQRDSWLKFKSMSQEKLVNFIESISRNNVENLQQWAATALNPGATQRIRNIQTSLKKHTKESRDASHMQHCKTYIELQSFCNEHNCEGGTSLVTFPEIDRRPDLWDVNLSQPNLLHILNLKKFSGQKKRYYSYEPDSESTTSDIDDIDIDYSENVPLLIGSDTHDIKCELLTSHHGISTEIVFLLLCSKRTEKWSSTTVDSLLENVLCSPECIFRELTS